MERTTDDATPADHLRALSVELLRALGAAEHGADLDECDDKLGFFAGIAANLARATELSAADRALHSAALFDMITKLADADAPGFARGWNTATDAQMIMMKASTRTEGGLSEEGYEILKLNAAALYRDEPSNSS